MSSSSSLCRQQLHAPLMLQQDLLSIGFILGHNFRRRRQQGLHLLYFSRTRLHTTPMKSYQMLFIDATNAFDQMPASLLSFEIARPAAPRAGRNGGISHLQKALRLFIGIAHGRELAPATARQALALLYLLVHLLAFGETRFGSGAAAAATGSDLQRLAGFKAVDGNGFLKSDPFRVLFGGGFGGRRSR